MAQTFWLSFIYIFLVLLMYPCCWAQRTNCQCFLTIIAVISFFFGMVFIGVFFGIFYKQVARDFDEANNCKIVEIQLADFDGSETYGGLGIQFTNSEGIVKYGMGCTSTKKKSGMATAPYTYSDYEKGDSIYCGGNGGVGVTKISKEDLESPYYNSDSNSRILYNQLPSNNGYIYNTNLNQDIIQGYNTIQQPSGYSYSSSSSYYSSYSYSYSSYSYDYGDDYSDYDEFKDDVKGLDEQLVYDKCYYTPYFSESGAEKNSDSETSVLDIEDFYLVTFEPYGYYNKTELLIFAGFFLIPFITYTNFCWIPYAAYPLSKTCPKFFKKKKTNAVVAQQKKPIQNILNDNKEEKINQDILIVPQKPDIINQVNLDIQKKDEQKNTEEKEEEEEKKEEKEDKKEKEKEDKKEEKKEEELQISLTPSSLFSNSDSSSYSSSDSEQKDTQFELQNKDKLQKDLQINKKQEKYIVPENALQIGQQYEFNNQDILNPYISNIKQDNENPNIQSPNINQNNIQQFQLNQYNNDITNKWSYEWEHLITQLTQLLK
ncbi:hypothetical protein PPERSA_04898 [Pseudocohnilembus persalinus]|uniref:Transmembrane protein n=1 Tax=Pseudocohnilembus persalinus TaxID=266149 RepID=A0A0V0QJ61_PSEPJ|nr:hypothetical protein PPERSA_04898 [Pseudocohnilembus persalinus]|eukprot:KRX02276.1 hypothetical protein PPERSA_04898 [Pseudocohnilembus persalinus]